MKRHIRNSVVGVGISLNAVFNRFSLLPMLQSIKSFHTNSCRSIHDHEEGLQLNTTTGTGSGTRNTRGRRLALSPIKRIRNTEDGLNLRDLSARAHEAFNGLKNLGFNDRQVRSLLKKFPQFIHFQCVESKLSSTIQFLFEKNIPLSRIFGNPWVLLDTPGNLEEKVKEVMTILNIDKFEVALPFANQHPSKLIEIAVLWNTEAKVEPALRDNNMKSRLEFLEFHLKLDSQFVAVCYITRTIGSMEACQQTDVADMMGKVDILKIMPFSHLETILMTLLDGGVRKVDIQSDPWVFENNLALMRDRLKNSRSRGLSIIKPWILRSPIHKFNSHVNRKIEEDALLKGHKSVGSFLQQKLNCNKITANEILSRVPSIQTASAVKLNGMIEFLYSQGFTADHIVETPRILGHSVETIGSRIKQLSKYNYQPDSLLVLCKTSKHYLSFIRRLQVRTPAVKSPAGKEE